LSAHIWWSLNRWARCALTRPCLLRVSLQCFRSGIVMKNRKSCRFRYIKIIFSIFAGFAMQTSAAGEKVITLHCEGTKNEMVKLNSGFTPQYFLSNMPSLRTITINPGAGAASASDMPGIKGKFLQSTKFHYILEFVFEPMAINFESMATYEGTINQEIIEINRSTGRTQSSYVLSPMWLGNPTKYYRGFLGTCLPGKARF